MFSIVDLKFQNSKNLTKKLSTNNSKKNIVVIQIVLNKINKKIQFTF